MGNLCSWEAKEMVEKKSSGGAPAPVAIASSTSASSSSSASAELTSQQDTSTRTNTKLDEDESLESDEDVDDDVVDDLPAPSPTYGKKGRQSVSAEAYGEWNKKKNFVAPVYRKTDEQKERITKTIGDSFLFNSLDAEDLETVLNAFQDQQVKEGETIIRQGDDGDRLYLIETGDVDVFKKLSGEEPKFMCKMSPGDAFGELALMYNAPRAATVKASTDLQLWALDRESFNHIVKDAAARKREIYEDSLKEVSLLKDMDPYERYKVADALKSSIFNEGDVIIQEGDSGDTFYILVDGEAEAIKEDKVVMSYKKGDYFGELALLKNQPRAATVKAKCPMTKVIYLDRKSFKRLLGPVENILMRNTENYKSVCERMGLDTKYLEK